MCFSCDNQQRGLTQGQSNLPKRALLPLWELTPRLPCQSGGEHRSWAVLAASPPLPKQTPTPAGNQEMPELHLGHILTPALPWGSLQAVWSCWECGGRRAEASLLPGKWVRRLHTLLWSSWDGEAELTSNVCPGAWAATEAPEQMANYRKCRLLCNHLSFPGPITMCWCLILCLLHHGLGAF